MRLGEAAGREKETAVTSLGVEARSGPASAAERALLRRIYEVVLLSRAVEERLWLLVAAGRRQLRADAARPRRRPGRQRRGDPSRPRLGLAVLPRHGAGAGARRDALRDVHGSLGRAGDPHSGSRQLDAAPVQPAPAHRLGLQRDRGPPAARGRARPTPRRCSARTAWPSPGSAMAHPPRAPPTRR